jgi:hypothetical protein
MSCFDQSRHGDRCVEAQELLHRDGHEVGLVHEPREVLGVVREMPQRRPDRAPRGVDARHEDEDIVPKTCSGAKLLTVDLHVQEIGGEVVARIGHVVFHLL